MISFYKPHGKVSLTNDYFAELVAAAVQSGYGVAGMADGGYADNIKTLLRINAPDRGVRVSAKDNELNIQLHIKVMYGLNIKEAAKSITHKVKYIVEEATGLCVNRIDVAVDDVVT